MPSRSSAAGGATAASTLVPLSASGRESDRAGTRSAPKPPAIRVESSRFTPTDHTPTAWLPAPPHEARRDLLRRPASGQVEDRGPARLPRWMYRWEAPSGLPRSHESPAVPEPLETQWSHRAVPPEKATPVPK